LIFAFSNRRFPTWLPKPKSSQTAVTPKDQPARSPPAARPSPRKIPSSHGLLARRNVIAAESQADYDLYRDQILGELNPLTPIESMLADRVICLSWRLKRAVRTQNQAIDALLQRNTSDPLAKLAQSFPLIFPGSSDNAQNPADDHLALGRVSIKDLSNARVTERLLMYERRIEHSLYKTLQELQRLTLTRNLQLQHEQSTTNDKLPTINNEQ
jgi:hypothetical protein